MNAGQTLRFAVFSRKMMQVGPKHVSGAAFAASAQHVGAYAATRMGGQRQAEATQAAAVLWQLTSAKRTRHTHQSSQGPAYACRTWQAASLGLHCHVVPCFFRSTRRLLRPCALGCNSRSTLSRQAAVPVRIHCGCTRRRRTETASAPAPPTGQKQAVLCTGPAASAAEAPGEATCAGNTRALRSGEGRNSMEPRFDLLASPEGRC